MRKAVTMSASKAEGLGFVNYSRDAEFISTNQFDFAMWMTNTDLCENSFGGRKGRKEAIDMLSVNLQTMFKEFIVLLLDHNKSCVR